MTLQVYTLALGNFRDDTSGNNYAANTPVYILNSGGTLADIFRDQAGAQPIVQDGLNNISDAYGEFTFYVNSGQYISRVAGRDRLINVVGSDYFDSRVDGAVEQITQQTLASRGFRVVGTFAGGFTYELFNDVGIDSDGNSWIYVGAGAPNKVVAAGTVPSVGTGYEQVVFNAASGVITEDGRSVQYYIDQLTDNSVTLEDFGVNAVNDAAIVFVNAMNYLIDTGNKKNTLILGSREYVFKSKAVVNCMSKGVNIIGYGDSSIIKSEVIGDSTVVISDMQRGSIRNFQMKGNFIYGTGGNGHAIKLNSSSSSGTIFPQNCDVIGLRFSGFRGLDVDLNNNQVAAMSIFVAGGKFINMSRILVDRCSWGVVYQDSGQSSISKSTFVSCDFFGVFVNSGRSGVVIENSDFVSCGFGGTATASEIEGIETPHGSILLIRCSNVVSSINNRVKTSVGGVTAYDCDVVTIDGCTLSPEDISTGGDSIILARGNRKVNVIGNEVFRYNGSDPLSIVTRGVLIGVNSNDGGNEFSVRGNTFKHAGNVEYDIKVEGLGSSRIFGVVESNIFGNRSVSGLDVLVDDCIILQKVSLSGSISDNLFFINENANSYVITSTLRFDSAGFDANNIYIKRNKEVSFGGGTFSNPIKESGSVGSGTYPTSSFGIFSIDPNLISTPKTVVLTPRGADPVFVVINSVTPDGIINVRAFNPDGSSYGNKNIVVHWIADVRAR